MKPLWLVGHNAETVALVVDQVKQSQIDFLKTLLMMEKKHNEPNISI